MSTTNPDTTQTRMPPPDPGTGLNQPDPQPSAPTPEPRTAAFPQASSQPSSDRGPGWGRRLVTGVLWGPLAVGAAALLQMWGAVQAGDEAARPLRMMTVLFEGASGLVNGDPVVGALVNVAIGLVLGLLFALLVSRARAPRAILVTGLAFGAGVFAVDHYLLAPVVSEVFELRDPAFLLATRLVLGSVLALGFLRHD